MSEKYKFSNPFLIADPERQYASLYVGMGNNPISGVDPTGGKNGDVILDGDEKDAAFSELQTSPLER